MRRHSPNLRIFWLTQLLTYKNFKSKKKKGGAVVETVLKCSQWDDCGGRILLGDNALTKDVAGRRCLLVAEYLCVFNLF